MLVLLGDNVPLLCGTSVHLHLSLIFILVCIHIFVFLSDNSSATLIATDEGVKVARNSQAAGLD